MADSLHWSPLHTHWSVPFFFFSFFFFFLRQHCKYSYVKTTQRQSTKTTVLGFHMFVEEEVIRRGWAGENEDETKFEWWTVMHSLSTTTQHVLRMSGRVTTCALTFHCCCNVFPQTPGLHKTQPNRVASHLGGQQCTTSITGLQSKSQRNCVPPMALGIHLFPCLSRL